jgi:hypothetical protein
MSTGERESLDVAACHGHEAGLPPRPANRVVTGKLIGVLTGTGGITGALQDIVVSLHKETGAEVMYDADPGRLVDRVLDRYQSQAYVCPCPPAERRGDRGGRDDR